VFAIFASEKLQEMSCPTSRKSSPKGQKYTHTHTLGHSCISQLIMGQANWKLEHSQIASQLEKSGEMAGRKGEKEKGRERCTRSDKRTGDMSKDTRMAPKSQS